MKMCVARYLEAERMIRCGKPDSAWDKEEDMLSVQEVQENAKKGYCRYCGSLERAVERKYFNHERRL